MRNLLLTLSLTALASSNLYAQEASLLSPKFSACMDKTEGTTNDMLNCVGEETKYQDSLLNKNYKTVIAQLSLDRQKQLKEAQRLWVKYRDANCNFYVDPEGGTMAVLNSASCFMETTAQRAKELANLQQE